MMKDYKVILVGRSGSGKTTAIRSVSEINVVSTDVLASDRVDSEKETTTVGFDYGELTIPGGQNRMRLYGTPGQERFTFMRDILERGSVGILLLADNHRPDPLAETRSWLRALKTARWREMQSCCWVSLSVICPPYLILNNTSACCGRRG
ncbi:GTP-binding protein [Raoultella ornithinolytica]